MASASRLQPQLNKDNKGASLVSLLLVLSIVAMIVTVILALVMMNVYMKKADKEGQKTFYDAEDAMDEIRLGLSEEVSDAASYAYIDTLTHYNEYTTAEEKNNHFESVYSERLQKNLQDNTGVTTTGTYDPDTLAQYFVETAWNEDEGYGAKIIKSQKSVEKGLYYINIDKDDGVVIKNVGVSYTSADGYETEIQTDICLEYPPIDFQNVSALENVLTYGIIANRNFSSTGGGTIVGNAFLGGGQDKQNTSKFFSTKDTTCTIDGTLKLEADENQDTTILSGTTIKTTTGSNVIAGDTKDNNQVSIWANSLDLAGKFQLFNSKSTLYLQNDLILNGGSITFNTASDYNSATKNWTTPGGRLILFGNTWILKSSDYKCDLYYNNENDSDLGYSDSINNNMADYSSSIIIKKGGSSIDMSQLDTMVIGGSSYVNTNDYQIKNSITATDDVEADKTITDDEASRYSDISTNNASSTESTSNEVVTGQSIIVKSDQRAYLIPSAVVGMKSDHSSLYDHGGTNPMTYDDFFKLQQEVYAQYHTGVNAGNVTEAEIEAWVSEIGTSQWQHYLVDFDAPIAAYGNVSLSKFFYGMYGVNNFKVRYFQSGNTTLVYLFMQFETVGNASDLNSRIPAEYFANYWYNQVYLSNIDNINKTNDNYSHYVKVNTDGSGGIKLPSNNATVYYTGDVVSYNGSIDSKLASINQLASLNIDEKEVSKQCAEYLNEFFYLRKSLNVTKANLASDALDATQCLFDNIVVEDNNDTNDDNDLVGSVDLDASGDSSSTDGGEYYVSTSDGVTPAVAAYLYDDQVTKTITGATKTLYICDTMPSTTDTSKYKYVCLNDNTELQNTEDSSGQKHSDAVLSLIITNGSVEIHANFDGCIIAKGDVSLEGGHKVSANAQNAARALQASKYDSNGNKHSVNVVIRNANNFLVGGYGDTTDHADSFTMSEFVTYRNWKRQ